MTPVFDEIVLLCPEAASGGPEAIHQLAHAVNVLGGKARLAYFSNKSTVAFLEDRLQCTPNPDLQLPQTYEAYAPQIFHETRLGARSLVIFPETLAKRALSLRGSARAIWWLSVDNAMVSDPDLDEQEARAKLFADPDLIHFYQSCYAHDFLKRNQARQMFPLYDYINRVFISEFFVDSSEIVLTAKKQQIAFFPRKGGALAALFSKTASGLQFIPIENMSKDEVRQALQQCAIFLDFGDQPGKDRVPREAAASGAVVFLHERGAAEFFADHPLERNYLFDMGDIVNGDLQRRVREVLADPGAHLRRQRYYRQRVRMEKEEFELQVRSFFFEGG